MDATTTLMDRLMDEQPDYSAPVEVTLPAIVAAEPAFSERCKKCRGTGSFQGYSGRSMGQCFTCKGKGKLTFKTSPEARERAKERVQERKAKVTATWAEAHPDQWAWIVARAPSFGFAASMLQAVNKYGHLTDGQLGAVDRCIVQDAERAVQRAAEQAEREARAAEVDISAITTAFYKAQLSGIKYPRLNLDTFKFKLSKKGPIYVTEAGAYLGKIANSKFNPSRECTPETQARIIAVCADPRAAAVAYGQRTGTCSTCGRELTNKSSIEEGIGPVCASKYGWS